MKYDPPEVTGHGSVESLTQAGGTNKEGSGNDEYSGSTGLTGSVF